MQDCNSMKNIELFGIKVSNLSTGEFIDKVKTFTKEEPKRKTIFYVNANCINITLKDKDYRDILSSANIVYPDGIGVVWAARLLGNPLIERINAADLFDVFCQEAVRNNLSLYLIGSKEDTLIQTVNNLKRKYPNLKIGGSYNGYFDREKELEMIEDINRVKPNILIIGLGVPKQEKWIYKNLDKINADVCCRWEVYLIYYLVD